VLHPFRVLILAPKSTIESKTLSDSRPFHVFSYLLNGASKETLEQLMIIDVHTQQMKKSIFVGDSVSKTADIDKHAFQTLMVQCVNCLGAH
jgi:hypothetical protein